ncbi:hypothetical protein B0H19DRAFT_1170080 [Mycena capillaripes]|nr:hypothetical protein B0H19DRAFT_1170080 [Mycena capillaripes]
MVKTPGVDVLKFKGEEKKPLKVEMRTDEPMQDMDIDSPLTELPNDFDMGGDFDAPATPSSDTGAMDLRITTLNAEDPGSIRRASQVSSIDAASAATHRKIIVKDEEMDIDLVATDMTRPEKRRRVLMDAVILPFVRSVRVHADAERNAIDQKLEQLRNPKVKKPKDTPILSLDTIRSRLRQHNISYEPYPIDLERDILDIAVTRDFMCKTYGGNRQVARPKIGAEFVKKTGKKYFLYPNLNFNPHCPEIPGAPGLLFNVTCFGDLDGKDDGADSDEDQGGDSGSGGEEEEGAKGDSHRDGEIEENKNLDEKESGTSQDMKGPFQWILFSRLDENNWQYQGQYITTPAPPLTVEEWQQQPPKVQNTWTKKLSKQGWGRNVRAEIVLRRRLRRKPTLAEEAAAPNNKRDKFLTVTAEEMHAAIDRGEVISIFACPLLSGIPYNPLDHSGFDSEMCRI